MSAPPADRLASVKAGQLFARFHGGPLHGEYRVIQAREYVDVPIYDPIPVDAPPSDHLHYRVGWYQGDICWRGIVVTHRDYFYQGERQE